MSRCGTPSYTEPIPYYSQGVPIYSQVDPIFAQNTPVYDPNVQYYSQNVPIYSQIDPIYPQNIPVYNQNVSYYPQNIVSPYATNAPVYTDANIMRPDALEYYYNEYRRLMKDKNFRRELNRYHKMYPNPALIQQQQQRKNLIYSAIIGAVVGRIAGALAAVASSQSRNPTPLQPGLQSYSPYDYNVPYSYAPSYSPYNYGNIYGYYPNYPRSFQASIQPNIANSRINPLINLGITW